MVAYSTQYLTQLQLTNAWGPEVMRQLFDDTNTDTLNTDAILLVIGRASAQVTSWMPDTYDGTDLPFAAPFIPEMIEECTFAYAQFLAFPRNPDFFRSIDVKRADLLKQAETLGQQLQSAIKRMYDATAPTPDNVGGDVESNDPNVGFATKPLFMIGSTGDF